MKGTGVREVIRTEAGDGKRATNGTESEAGVGVETGAESAAKTGAETGAEWVLSFFSIIGIVSVVALNATLTFFHVFCFETHRHPL